MLLFDVTLIDVSLSRHATSRRHDAVISPLIFIDIFFLLMIFSFDADIFAIADMIFFFFLCYDIAADADIRLLLP